MLSTNTTGEVASILWNLEADETHQALEMILQRPAIQVKMHSPQFFKNKVILDPSGTNNLHQ